MRFTLRGSYRIAARSYCNLRGQYDKIVSIEMFEAVRLSYYDPFFRACDRLLRPDGAMLMQTINEQAFPAYHRSSDWIQKHIFPASELASVSETLRSLSHGARTLAAWRKRFQRAVNQVRELGFDDRFIRMWDFQLLTENHNPRTLFQEPWSADRVELELCRGAAR